MPDWTHEEFLTVAEVASLLKLNQQTIRNWIDADKLPALRIGRRVRVLRSDLQLLIDRSTSQPRDQLLDQRQPEPESMYTAQAFWDGTPSFEPVQLPAVDAMPARRRRSKP